MTVFYFTAVLLAFLVDPAVVKKVQEGHIIEKKEIRDWVSPAILEDSVSINSVKDCFAPNAWTEILRIMAILKSNPKWKCSMCDADINENCDKCVFL